MYIHHAFEQSDGAQPSVVTIGTFDGVHLGHQQLIRAAISDAQSRKAQTVVITFHPHPRVVLSGVAVNYLTSPDEKAEQMRRLGIDLLLILPFTPAIAQTPAAQFVDWMRAHLDLQSLWIGHDFALGHRRQGNAAFLAEQGQRHGFTLNVVPEFSLGQETISSTRIRAALARGDVRDADMCLGRPFRLAGTVFDAQRLCLDAQHTRPAPGRYAVLIDGMPNEATIESAAPQLRLAQPIQTMQQIVTVDFHDTLKLLI